MLQCGSARLPPHCRKGGGSLRPTKQKGSRSQKFSLDPAAPFIDAPAGHKPGRTQYVMEIMVNRARAFIVIRQEVAQTFAFQKVCGISRLIGPNSIVSHIRNITSHCITTN
jgi:hypothetical protein